LYRQKRGRPQIKEARETKITVRLNIDEAEMLEYLTEKTGEKRSRILREGLIMRYNLSKTLE